MNKETLYTKFNTYRKAKFDLRTEVVTENGKKYVYKIAQYEEGKEFIQHIYNSYKNLSKLNLPFEINNCELIDGSTLKFDYIQGTSLLNEFEDVTKSNNFDLFVNKFKEFQNLLNKIPSKKGRLGKDFEKVFGPIEEDKTCDLIIPGILDLNLDNIIRDERGILHLIDYEWCFDFGIPRRYVLYRTIYYVFLHLRAEMKGRWDMDEFEKEHGYSESEIKNHLKWENNFQEYVTDKKGNYIQNFNSRLEFHNNTFKKRTLLIDEKELQEKIGTLEKDKEQLEMERATLQNKKATLQNEKATLQNEKDSLLPDAQEFKVFKQTKIWRALSIYRKFKKKLKLP